MNRQNQEILAIIILGAILALLLVGFIVAILFLYQRKQNEYKKEMAIMQDEYDQQILRVQFEMQEITLKEIADKLHDGLKNNIVVIIQKLNLIGFLISKNNYNQSQLADDINQISTELVTLKDEIRLTSHSLSTDRIAQVGLIDAIKFEVKRMIKMGQIRVDFYINETHQYYFSEKKSVYLFRMFQEIVGNVIAHSKASELKIIVDMVQPSTFLLDINDNGVGFDLNEKRKSKQSGMGLFGMQKRALQLGGNISIQSAKLQGTKIIIQLPLSNSIVTTNNQNDTPKKQTQNSFN